MREESVERFFEEYAERYMAFDADAIAAMYEVPFLAVREGRPIHLGDRAAVREHLAALMDAYRKGWRGAGDHRRPARPETRRDECYRDGALERHL